MLLAVSLRTLQQLHAGAFHTFDPVPGSLRQTVASDRCVSVDKTMERISKGGPAGIHA